MYPMGTAYKVGRGFNVMEKATTVNVSEWTIIESIRINEGLYLHFCMNNSNKVSLIYTTFYKSTNTTKAKYALVFNEPYLGDLLKQVSNHEPTTEVELNDVISENWK